MICELNHRRFAMLVFLFFAYVGTICLGEDNEFQTSTPELFLRTQFNAVSLVNAANHCIRLGETETLREFERLIRENGAIPTYNLEERVFWLCRILFAFEENAPIRPPQLGTLPLPHDQFHLTDWPIYPLAKSGNSYFVLCEGYSLAGMPEPIDQYFKLCKAHGNFRTESIVVPSILESQQDLMRLQQSNQWKRINWKNRYSWYTTTETIISNYMTNQCVEK